MNLAVFLTILPAVPIYLLMKGDTDKIKKWKLIVCLFSILILGSGLFMFGVLQKQLGNEMTYVWSDNMQDLMKGPSRLVDMAIMSTILSGTGLYLCLKSYRKYF